MAEDQTIILKLSQALQKIITTPPRIIASPPTQPKRGAVAIILRVVPPSPHVKVPEQRTQPTIAEFFNYEWVRSSGSRAEILFLERESPGVSPVENATRSRQERHVAFPGGKAEEGDEDGKYTAMRHTWEEIGLDLQEREYLCIGQLDDREITTSLGKRLLMILSPYVFLQVTPHASKPDVSEGTVLHWTPLLSLANKNPLWSYVTVDVASRLAPKNSVILRTLIRALIGSMQFSAIVLNPLLPPEKGTPVHKYLITRNLKLWGLTLGMTLDLLAYMNALPSQDVEVDIPQRAAPRMTSVVPRFSYPDVNFWIWVFGKRYREVVRGWESSLLSGGSNDRRINWVGTALNSFYAAVRKALVLVLILRAIGILFGLGIVSWWLFLRVNVDDN